ncbi:MAG: c-type cytochrome [Candidatus Acidiferrales bacterium]
MRPALISAFVLLASVVAAAAGGGHDKIAAVDDRGVLLAIAQAPAKTRAWKNPYEGQPDAIAAGAKLYRQHCAECHGEDGRGRGHAADLRSAKVRNATPGELAWLLRNGNLAHGMPPWAGIPEQRRWQIVAYLKSLH